VINIRKNLKEDKKEKKKIKTYFFMVRKIYINYFAFLNKKKLRNTMPITCIIYLSE